MRPSLTAIILILCAITAGAARVSGIIYTKGKIVESVEVGYLGITADKEEISNLAGFTPNGCSGNVVCTTYAPRNTALAYDKAKGWSYEHTGLPKGRYLLYVKYGEAYLDWQVIEVKGDEVLRVSFGINLVDKVGELTFRITKGPGTYRVALFPLDDNGKPVLERKDYAFYNFTSGKVKGQSITLRDVRMGQYRLTLQRVNEVGEGFSTMDDLGVWDITVKAGKRLEYQIP